MNPEVRRYNRQLDTLRSELRRGGARYRARIGAWAIGGGVTPRSSDRAGVHLWFHYRWPCLAGVETVEDSLAGTVHPEVWTVCGVRYRLCGGLRNLVGPRITIVSTQGNLHTAAQPDEVCRLDLVAEELWLRVLAEFPQKVDSVRIDLRTYASAPLIPHARALVEVGGLRALHAATRVT